MQSAAKILAFPLCRHPNEMDRKRIERALQSRSRYRYVVPSVVPVEGGYRIESPCCSRNIDPDGGVIDVALLHYEAPQALWSLYSRDHRKGTWVLHSHFERLHEILDLLKTDPQRRFWQ